MRIKGSFESKMGLMGGRADGFFPPALFGKTDAMLACDGSVPGNDLAEKFIQGDLGTLTEHRVVHAGDHDVHVDVTIASMTKTGHGKATLSLQFLRKINQINQPAARHDNVFIKLDQTGISQAVTELTAELPESFTGLVSESFFKAGATEIADQLGKRLQFSFHGRFLSINLH